MHCNGCDLDLTFDLHHGDFELENLVWAISRKL